MVLGLTRRCSKSSGKNPHVSSKMSESSFARVSKSGRDRGRKHLARRKGSKKAVTCNSDATALRRGGSHSQLPKRPRKGFADATALRRGDSRSQLPKRPRKGFADATALRRGGSRSQLQTHQKVFCRCHSLVPALVHHNADD